MKKNLLYILIVLIFSSCGTGLKIAKKNFSPIEKNYQGTFYNTSYLTKGRYNATATILDFFDLFNFNTDNVHIYFDNEDCLVLLFKYNLGNRIEKFDGKFHRKGFYEIYLRNKKKSIPPFFSIIYGYRDIDRIRIGLTKDNDLVIDNKWARDGNIFLLAGGGSGRYLSYFKLVK